MIGLRIENASGNLVIPRHCKILLSYQIEGNTNMPGDGWWQESECTYDARGKLGV